MIRPVQPQDVKYITDIYNEYILNSTYTFETEPISEDEMRLRIAQIFPHFPFFVCETDHKVVGYCYAHPWKQRTAYRYTLETTVYLSARHRGKGLGKLLMQVLIEECRQHNYHTLIACITACNTASCSLHSKLGFTQVSHFKEVGMKFGEWLDVADYELILK